MTLKLKRLSAAMLQICIDHGFTGFVVAFREGDGYHCMSAEHPEHSDKECDGLREKLEIAIDATGAQKIHSETGKVRPPNPQSSEMPT
jgi:hypothetical protein